VHCYTAVLYVALMDCVATVSLSRCSGLPDFPGFKLSGNLPVGGGVTDSSHVVAMRG
jgi:hypothetical protein